jgi:uncharacterized protein
MHKQIYVNLPIKDMDKSQAFFRSLGFSFNPEFTNEQGACMVISENIFAMLLVEDYFKTFTKKNVVNAKDGAEVIVCLSCDTREEVDTLVAKAMKGGATQHNEAQDHGFMYIHGFQDLDGHLWELAVMAGEPPAN